MENHFIRFLQKLFFQSLWQVIYENVFLLIIELFLNIRRLLNIVVNLLGQFDWHVIIICKLFKYFKLFAFLQILSSYVTDQSADTVDVIGQHDAANHFKEDQAKCFLVSGSC